LLYFKDPLIIILLIAAGLSGLTGSYTDSGIIILMIFLSIGMNFYQESKSSKAAEELAQKLEISSNVLRNGKIEKIRIKYIVPGDIIEVAAGDIIPADGKIIESDDLFINESSLTGESFPVEK
jgi:P-type Mg2+ transporter